MAEEQLKLEAENYADKWIKHAIDHKSLTYWNSCVDGYIAGAEPREKRIDELEERLTEAQNEAGMLNNSLLATEDELEELKKENAELRNNGFTVSAMTEQQLKEALEKGERLEKENEELSNNYNMLNTTVGNFEELQEKLEDEQRKNNGLEAQIEKMLHTFVDLLWFENNLDPYMYECNDAQKGELLKPFSEARNILKAYACKKCKGTGTIFTKKWHIKTTCPACKGTGYVLGAKRK